jgi:2-oxoglutarate dehydrogenase E1 component
MDKMSEHEKRGERGAAAPGAVEGNVGSLGFVEELYAAWLEEPSRVSEDWRAYFDQLDGNGTAEARLGPSFEPRGLFDAGGGGDGAFETARLQHRVDQLIRNFRVRGHRIAELDPLGRPRPEVPELDPAQAGLRPEDMDRQVTAPNLPGGDVETVGRILERLRNTYCRHIGAQFMHIDDLSVRRWLQRRMERTENHIQLHREQQVRILELLTEAVVFEQFVQKKYVGAKSFSLEGAESLIPLLSLAFEKAGEHGVDEIVLGMAHRGRLNVLANLLGKDPQEIFREFEEKEPRRHRGSGDVKYHLGHGNAWTLGDGRELHLSLCFNPSHLEFINPVAMGRLRAKQDRTGDLARERGLLLLIHGDASFAGEGVVQESLNLSQLEAYTVGGALHVIVNNQLGFTTPPEQGRSSTYATDVGKMLQIPIFHVNGEYPEAVAQVVSLAMDFRREFHRDVIIDMYCYRLRGHNEGDEPSFTQPQLYEVIRNHKSVRDSYLEHLLELGGITREDAEEIVERKTRRLEEALGEARSGPRGARSKERHGIWAGYRGGDDQEVDEADTGVAEERLSELLDALARVPDDFHPHKKIARGLELRREMAKGEKPLDWAAGEALAFATLAVEGHRVRMSGQDSERGTFSHRHAVFHDVENGDRYVPLQNLSPDQAPVEIWNSPLSEAGVMGFEYGYSLDYPDALVVWEAQFGDFFNAGQVVVDQFLSSAEDKWNRLTGLVLLLPHGFEGQGPEHSSARLERWLILAAEDNLQVVYPTTPAQLFHCLRRQVLRPYRKPLVVMTPKSHLRHPEVISSLEELASGRFRRVIPDDRPDDAPNPNRVLLCTGKIYQELRARRQELERDDVAIVRLEQLYPFPSEPLRAALSAYRDETPVIWVQEEPRNMGAWPYLRAELQGMLFDRLPLTGIHRRESASPATGSHASHKLEQEELIDRAFGGG